MILNLDDYRSTLGLESIEHPDLNLLPLVMQWRGSTPYQAAKLIAEEYCRRFPNSKVFPVDTSKPNPLNLETGSWYGLEQLCRMAARTCMDEEEYFFWDQMRGEIFQLEKPLKRNQRAVIKAQENYQDCKERTAKGEDVDKADWADTVLPVVGVGVCQYCWRAVPYRQGENTSKLRCHQHSAKTYNQRNRAQLRKLGAEAGFFPAEGTHIEVPGVMSKIPERSGLDALLPHLPHVLEFLIANGLKNADSRDVVMTLEGEIGPEPKDISYAREMFYVECALAPVWYRQHFLWAEAWLKLEATINDSRGGKRTGAGRPKKKAS